jgi:cytochrome c biogenesis protein CcmG/thiol:disulfide interchange protein DsbE
MTDAQKPTGIDLNGEPLNFDEQYAGKPVLINFWASWCVPCRAEFPLLEQVSDDVAVIGVVSRDTAPKAREFADAEQSSWRHIVDDGSLAAAWKAGPGLPVTFAVDADGVVQRRQFGELSEIDLNAMLDAVGVDARLGE